jgi:transcription elongation factor Elf1
MASSNLGVEGEDFVRCRVCGFETSTLATHLRKHGLKADEYRHRYPGARIRSKAVEAKRRAAIKKAHERRPTRGAQKVVECPECGDPHQVSRFDRKAVLCPLCAAERAESVWEGKEEGLDYVVCDVCGYRAENLTSHIQNHHPELAGRYPGQVIAERSAVRDKSALKGRPLSAKTRAKMSRNAGRWNKGLTKETDERVARSARNMEGRRAWSEGLTKEIDPRLRGMAENLSRTRQRTHWTNGTEVRLTKAQLLQFRLKNGKVSVGKAMAALGHAFVTIRRECRRHGLPIAHTNVAEHFVVETISRILGGAKYVSEWSSVRFINPATGRRLRYDAYFPGHHFLVEFHGRQHWEPVGFYEGKGELFEQLQARDQLKIQLARAASHPLLIVREDEPWQDADHLEARLRGVISLWAL